MGLPDERGENMSGKIIRQGDPTSHGGKVLEGSTFDICHGKPISFIGHKVSCPKCKGVFPIIEGVLTTTFYGKGVALAGMKTGCGAVLIATQFLDTFELGSGSGASNGEQRSASAGGSCQEELAQQQSADTSITKQPSSDDIDEEHFYTLVDASGNPAEGYRYDLHCDGTLHTKGGRYAAGATVSAKAAEASHLVSWLERDGGSKS
jgi:uncharacterized Zn-binding protein involved in type VI secretion